MSYDWDGKQSRRLKLIQGVSMGIVVASIMLFLVISWTT